MSEHDCRGGLSSSSSSSQARALMPMLDNIVEDGEVDRDEWRAYFERLERDLGEASEEGGREKEMRSWRERPDLLSLNHRDQASLTASPDLSQSRSKEERVRLSDN